MLTNVGLPGLTALSQGVQVSQGLFTSDGKDQVVMQALHQTVRMTKEWSHKLKLSIYQFDYTLTLSCGHEHSVGTGKTKVTDTSGGKSLKTFHWACQLE